MTACGGGSTASTPRRPQAPATATATATATAPARQPPPGSSGALTVTPSIGHSTTTFRLGFRAPAAGGRRGRLAISYALRVAGPVRPGCVAVRSAAVRVPRAGAAVRVSVGPPGRWCAGRYVARVQELVRPVCAPGQVCPQFIRVIATIGPATFRVIGG